MRVIEKVRNSEWAAPIVPVVKPDNSIRVGIAKSPSIPFWRLTNTFCQTPKSVHLISSVYYNEEPSTDHPNKFEIARKPTASVEFEDAAEFGPHLKLSRGENLYKFRKEFGVCLTCLWDVAGYKAAVMSHR